MLAPELLISLIVEEAEVASQSCDAEPAPARGRLAPARVREHRERYEMGREPAVLMGWTHVQ